MKKISIYFLLLTFLPLINSCSKKDDGGRENEEFVEFLCGEEISTIEGAICCVYGSDLASPDEILTYEYESNVANPFYEWTVSYGSVTIVSGANAATATIAFGSDFTTAEIVCHATQTGGGRKCGEKIIIHKK